MNESLVEVSFYLTGSSRHWKTSSRGKGTTRCWSVITKADLELYVEDEKWIFFFWKYLEKWDIFHFFLLSSLYHSEQALWTRFGYETAGLQWKQITKMRANFFETSLKSCLSARPQIKSILVEKGGQYAGALSEETKERKNRRRRWDPTQLLCAKR